MLCFEGYIGKKGLEYVVFVWLVFWDFSKLVK